MNVLVDKNKIDLLANAISAKSGEPVTMTLEEMVDAVDGIETGGGIIPTGNIDITQAGTTDVTNYATATVPDNAVIDNGINGTFRTVNGARKWDATVWFDYLQDGIVGGGINYAGKSIRYNAVPANTTITPTESAQTIGGANYMMEGAVTVAAIPSDYVGSGITQRSSSDLTTSGATVTAPAGYYTSSASKTVASGTAGTPTATKGTVSNHSVSVTPSVTNQTGYIIGSTKTGTAVTVTASELVSGSETKTSNGTYDVTNLAQLVVNVSGSGGANFATATMTNSSNQAQSIAFTLPSGRTPKAFFCRLTSQITRNSSYRYYYVENIRWDGSTTGGVAGRCFYMYSGQLTNITSGYSHSQDGTTFTLTTTGTRSASPGSFYNGTYELVYVY